MAEQIQIKPEIIISLKSSIESLSNNIVSLNKNLENVIASDNDDSGLDAENQKEQRSIANQMLNYLKLMYEQGEKDVDKESGSNLGKIALVVAAALGALYGYLSKYVKVFSQGVKLAAKALDVKFFKGSIGKALTNITNSIKTFATKIGNTFKENKVIKMIKGMFDTIKNFVSNIGSGFKDSKAIKGVKWFFSQVKNLFSSIIKAGKFLGNIVGSVGKSVSSVMKFFGNVASAFGKFVGVFKTFAGLASRLFYPITIIIGLFEGVMKAVERFKSDGIIGGIVGFIEGAINGIIMKPLDLLKDVVSWILGKLGFDGASEALDSFSFEELFSSIVDTIMGWFKGAVNWVKEKFTNVKDAIGAFFGKKPTEIIEERDEAYEDYRSAEETAKYGAMGKNEDGERVQFRKSRNGVYDQAGAKAQLAAEGYTEMSPDEIKAEVAEERATYDKAQARLDRYEARPSLAKLVSPDSGLAESIQPAQPQGGDTIAGASSEVDSLKAAGQAVSNNVAVSSPTTNISNSTNNNLIKPPVRNVDPSLNQYYRNKFQMAL